MDLSSFCISLPFIIYTLPVCRKNGIQFCKLLPSEGSTASRIWKIHTSSSSMTCILPASNPKVR